MSFWLEIARQNCFVETKKILKILTNGFWCKQILFSMLLELSFRVLFVFPSILLAFYVGNAHLIIHLYVSYKFIEATVRSNE